MGDRDWHVWQGVNGMWFARLPQSSPPVVVSAPLEELPGAIDTATAGLRDRTYWPDTLAGR